MTRHHPLFLPGGGTNPARDSTHLVTRKPAVRFFSEKMK
jgi:hypothetical protein